MSHKAEPNLKENPPKDVKPVLKKQEDGIPLKRKDSEPNIPLPKSKKTKTHARKDHKKEREKKDVGEQANYKETRRKCMWNTVDMGTDIDREEFLKAVLRDTVIYIFFLITILTYALLERSSARYLLHKAVKDQVKLKGFTSYNYGWTTLKDIKEIIDIWYYLEHTLVKSIYWDYYYDQYLNTMESEKMILMSNHLVGVGRIRQVRMAKDSCRVPNVLRESFENCYYRYSIGSEDTSPYSLGIGTAYTYSTSYETGSYSFTGKYTKYGGGGYYFDFLEQRNNTMKALADLRKNQWIDRGTRAIFVDFTVYNPNVNLFAISKIIFELPSSGGVITDIHIVVVRLMSLNKIKAYVTLLFQCLFYGFIIFYAVEELRDIIFLKLSYFTRAWNYVDLIIIVLGMLMLILTVIKEKHGKDQVNIIVQNPNAYGNMELLAKLTYSQTIVMSLEMFIIAIKVFKYINVNKSMSQLHVTLQRCALNMLAFSILFFIVFCAFAIMGYLFFGMQVESYSNFSTAMFTLLRTILGDFDYQEIEEVNKILAPIFFLSFVFIVFFVLLNMFLAIINDAYSEVKTELSITVQDMHMWGYVKMKFRNMCKKCKLPCKTKITDKEEPETYDTTLLKLKEAFKRFNFSDMEIEMFFARFNIKLNARMRDVDFNKLVKELQTPPKPPDADVHSDIGYVHAEDFKGHQNRLGQLEETMGKLSDQMDNLIVKIDNMTKSK